MADLVIRGGTVVDGTGSPGVVADVAITAGRIEAIGPDLEGTEELDATGQIVAPGFIDIHTHYDAQVFWDPDLTPSCFHGVTSVVAGNCGFSIAPTRPEHRDLIARTLENVEDMDVDTLEAGIPWDFTTFPEYLESVAKHGSALNFGAYIGHTALRLFVMGDDGYERAATQDEIDEMARVVGEAIDAGAVGLATSFAMTHRGADGKPIPSRHAEAEEFRALARVVGERKRGVVSIAPGDQVGIADMYGLQREIGVPITFGALLTTPGGRFEQLAQMNEKAAAEGAQVWPQVSPRPLQFQMTMREPFTLNVNTEFGKLMATGDTERLAAYADPVWRQASKDAFATQTGMLPRWGTFVIAETANRSDLHDRRLSEIAEELGQEPLDALLDLAVADGLDMRVNVVLANDDPEGVAYLLSQEHCTLGLSDAGAHVGQLCDAPQATDFLGNWVRDRSLMPIETAVRKLTGVQADLFGFADRGYLKEGYCADVVVFDPATVAPGPLRRVRDFPANAERLTADAPEGVTHVLVNGTPIRLDGEPVLGSSPGQMLQSSAR
jgi:N-acyl-D-amino-acid deacylase